MLRVLKDARRHHHQVVHVPFILHEDNIDRLRAWEKSLSFAHTVKLVDHLADSFWVFGVWSYEALGARLHDITCAIPRFVIVDRESTSTQRLCGCSPDEWRSCQAVRDEVEGR
jgi:hypothetical protein